MFELFRLKLTNINIPETIPKEIIKEIMVVAISGDFTAGASAPFSSVVRLETADGTILLCA
jgi:hypothetical protein